MLIGREHELGVLTALLEQARHGSAGCLVVRGEPGVGKSALLDVLVRTADGAIVLRTQGLEVEAPLAFAALHRLLRPVARLRDQLPAPQARALRVAFGEDEGAPVEPFLVGVAALTILTTAAEESLVLCVIDDAHWLDPASADALRFCGRRLGADRVAMVFSARDRGAGRFDAPDLDELVLTGLDPSAARALLDLQVGDDRTDAVTARIIEETRGNPLALMELPTELTRDQLRGAAPLPPQLHLTERVEAVFLERSRRLPRQEQTVLLLAAADDTGDLALIRRAGARLSIDEEVLEAALRSGLLAATDDVVTLRHPLVRSAIYQAATDAERRRAHSALADALDESGDADRRAWHLAAAAEGPDPEVVEALRLVGMRAQLRGGHDAALAAYARAATLSGDLSQRAALAFEAARSAWACGQATQAGALLATASESARDPALVCDIATLRGHVEVNLGSATAAHRIFAEAAHGVHATDPARALDLAVRAAIMRTYGADSGTPLPAADLLAHGVEDSPRNLCLERLLASMTFVADGDWARAAGALDEAAKLGEQVDDREVLWNLANAALQLGDDDAERHFYELALSRARETGAVTAVIYALQRLCFGHFLAGDVTAVRLCAEEARSLGTSTGQMALTAAPLAWLALLAALQGRDDYEDCLRELEGVVAAQPLGILAGPVHDVTRWAKAIRATSDGDSAGALHHLGKLKIAALARMAAVEHVDVAVRAGDAASVAGLVEELAVFADATLRPWALGAVAYGRAVTDDSAGAESLFEESLAHYSQAGRPLDEARVRLAYGEWLRRSQRRVDARTHLRLAMKAFQDARAGALAERAAGELRASGETARKRDPSTLVSLTPMERKVAQLVCSGLSNKEVAAQCWVSPRTVAFHLRNVFAKAGVTSRGELAQLDLA